VWTLPGGLVSLLFWIAAAACAVAQLFILRAVFRQAPGAVVSASVPAPHRTAEIIWVLLPMLGLAAAFVGAWRLTFGGR
jgi:hypothetical protein